MKHMKLKNEHGVVRTLTLQPSVDVYDEDGFHLGTFVTQRSVREFYQECGYKVLEVLDSQA